MKKLSPPTWVTASLDKLLPDRIFSLGKKTPWYRRSWMANVPWIGFALMMPFAAFLLWKGIRMLRASITS